MRKYIVFGMIMAILIGILIYLYLPKEKIKEIYVVTEAHNILYEKEQSFGVKYFSNQKNIINDKDIAGGFIYNEDESIKFQIESVSIKKMHDERYLEQLYYGYEFLIKLPDITDSYEMSRLYLRLQIKDQSYEFFVGSLFVEYPSENENYIGWYGIEGIKSEGPQLFQILVDIKNSVDILGVYIGLDEQDYFEGDQNIVITLKPNDYVFMTTFVKISSTEGISYLPNFTYFMNYELLASGLHHNYIIM